MRVSYTGTSFYPTCAYSCMMSLIHKPRAHYQEQPHLGFRPIDNRGSTRSTCLSKILGARKGIKGKPV
jgi:hypothetical protein